MWNQTLNDPLLGQELPSSWGNVPTRLHYEQPQRMYQADNPNAMNANRGDLLQEIGTDIAIDQGMTALQNKFSGPTTMQGAPPSASSANTTLQAGKSAPYSVQSSQPYSVTQSTQNYSITSGSPQSSGAVPVKPVPNPTSSASSSAAKAGRKLKGIPAKKFGMLRKYSKGAKVAGRLAPVLGTLAMVGTAASQAGETQAMGKDLGGQAAGNVVGASLGGKLGAAAGAGLGAAATAATGGLAAPLVPVLSAIGGAIGGTLGMQKGGEIGREVNLIPDKPKAGPSLSESFEAGRGNPMSRQSGLYGEQVRRTREQAQDALFMRGLANEQQLEADKARMMLQGYMNQQQQFGQMMSNAIR